MTDATWRETMRNGFPPSPLSSATHSVSSSSTSSILISHSFRFAKRAVVVEEGSPLSNLSPLKSCGGGGGGKILPFRLSYQESSNKFQTNILCVKSGAARKPTYGAERREGGISTCPLLENEKCTFALLFSPLVPLRNAFPPTHAPGGRDGRMR